MVEELQQRVEGIARERGFVRFGVADLEAARDTIIEWGRSMDEKTGSTITNLPLYTKFPRAISIGYPVATGVVEGLYHHNNRSLIYGYYHYVYQNVALLLDRTGLEIATMLHKEGYKSYPIPAVMSGGGKSFCSPFSHKLAARLAGMGWIGKNTLLITPEMGPRILWMTILTDAPLKASEKPILENRCGNCTRCIDICPLEALTGVSYNKPKPRSELLDASKCGTYLMERASAFGNGAMICSLCFYACPIGRGEKYEFEGRKERYVGPGL